MDQMRERRRVRLLEDVFDQHEGVSVLPLPVECLGEARLQSVVVGDCVRASRKTCSASSGRPTASRLSARCCFRGRLSGEMRRASRNAWIA